VREPTELRATFREMARRAAEAAADEGDMTQCCFSSGEARDRP
jgi:hypothetical protein